MDYILETKDLTRKYGSKTAVDRVNMHIPEGKIYGLIGRNGAGKTTIMRMISGLSTPTSGDYALFGKTGSERGRLLRQVGVLIEEPGIYPKYSAQENLKIKCIALGVDPRTEVPRLLEAVGMEEVDSKKGVGSFSLGMRQRIGIALALVGNPKLLVLDEPINGLDPQGIVEVRQILVGLRDQYGISILISSHILEELDKVADLYGVIHEGQLLDEFSAKDMHLRSGKYVKIRTDNTEAALKVLAGMDIPAQAMEEQGCIRVSGNLDRTADMSRALVGAGVGLEEIFVRSLSLEDYYLRMTGGGRHE
jgi:ABC-2 type transport system ATP-binding protein